MFDKLDKIVIDDKDLEKIRKYIESKGDEKVFNYPMEKGVLILCQNINHTMHGITLNGFAKQAVEFDFDNEASVIRISIFSTDVFDTLEEANRFDPILKAIIDVSDSDEIIVKIVDNKLSKMSNEVAENSALSSLYVLMDVLFYMSDFKSNEIIEVTEVKTVKKKYSGKNKKKSKSNVVRITTKKYVIDKSKIPSNAKNIRRILQWTVRGHWRYYKKSGKKVWINPYTKGNKEEEVNPKEYRL